MALKRDERDFPETCWNRATDDEMIFVLLSRDKAAPTTIRCWIHERLRLGLNKPDDPQILNAKTCADFMEKQWRDKRG